MSAAILERAAAFLAVRGFSKPDGAVLLPPGLQEVFSGSIAKDVSIRDIPDLAALDRSAGGVGSVAGGEALGRVGLLELNGARILQFFGLAGVIPFVRLSRSLGAPWLALVAEGVALRGPFEAGDAVFVTDHIQWIGENPLIGSNDDRIGPRFPDMSNAYSARLRSRGATAARAAGIACREGVLVGFPHARAVTPAEARMLALAGGDFVAAGIVPAAIAAVHCGLEVMGIVGIESVAASGPPPGDAAAEARKPASLDAGMGRAAIRSKIGAIIQGLLRGDTA